MKYQRAKAGFFRYADGKLLVVGGRIINQLKHSSFFTAPEPSLAEGEEVEAAYLDYQQKVFKASGGGLLHSPAKRESKRRLADLLQKLAFYVSVKSDGDRSRLYSSGFPVLDKKRKGTSLDTPGAPFLQDGRVHGEITYGFKPVGRDTFYDYCFAAAAEKSGNPIWRELRTTTRSFKTSAGGFTPGSYYIYFRVRARNRHSVSHWTDPIRRIVG